MGEWFNQCVIDWITWSNKILKYKNKFENKPPNIIKKQGFTSNNTKTHKIKWTHKIAANSLKYKILLHILKFSKTQKHISNTEVTFYAYRNTPAHYLIPFRFLTHIELLNFLILNRRKVENGHYNKPINVTFFRITKPTGWKQPKWAARVTSNPLGFIGLC